MFATVVNYQRSAANDGVISRTRTVPIPTSITAVPNYPNKLVVYKIAASKYWQVRCWHAGRSHKRSTKTTKLNLAQRFARWFYEQLLVKYSTHVKLFTTEHASVDTDTAKQLTFGAVAAQVYANEQARVLRGEYGAGSLRMFRNRLDAQILPAIGAKYIDQITYQLLLLFAQSLSAKFSTTTVSHYLVIVRKVLTHAKRTDLIEQVPDVPKIKVRSTSRGAFTPTEYWQLLRAARALRSATHPDTRKDMRKKLHQCYNNNMPPDVAWAIGFMVNSFIRPGDLVKLRHRHVEVVHSRQTYLRLTLPETKLHDAPIVTLQPAVRIYQQICQHQTAHKRANTNDHVFLPDIPNRQYAMNVLGYMFNWVLQHTGLKLNAHGNPRSLYSLRHSAITFRLLYGQGIDLITLARNARTSVEVINNHYASTVRGEQNIAMLQSRRT